MRRRDLTCSVLWSQGPRVEAPACPSPSSPSRLGLASLQLQPHPPGPGPQPACWALVAPDTAPAREPPHQLSIFTWAEWSLEGRPGRAQRGGGGWGGQRGRTEGPRTARGHVAGKERAQSGPEGGAAWWLLLRGGRGLQWRKLSQSTHSCPQGRASLLSAGPRQAQLQHVEVGGDTPGVWGSLGSGKHPPPSPLKTDPGMLQAPENRPTGAGSVFTQAEACPGPAGTHLLYIIGPVASAALSTLEFSTLHPSPRSLPSVQPSTQ